MGASQISSKQQKLPLGQKENLLRGLGITQRMMERTRIRKLAETPAAGLSNHAAASITPQSQSDEDMLVP